jgi:hypothetical protein
MQRFLEAGYALGRLAFGAGLLTAPERLGGVLLGERIGNPDVRMSFRFYGTRDVVLGLGTLGAVVAEGEVAPWLLAGIASDVLDSALQLAEWSELPPDKRLPGLLAALAAAGAGAALLARR